MRPRLALLLGALVVPALSVVSATPAEAAGLVYCVNMPVGTACTATYPTLGSAVTAANGPVGDVEIKVGPGAYNDGPYTLDGTGRSVTVTGSGATGNGATRLTVGSDATKPYFTGTHVTLTHLRVDMTTGTQGLKVAGGSQVQNVVVNDTAATTGATGVLTAASTLRDVNVNLLDGTGNTAVSSTGGSSSFDSNWSAGTGYVLASSGASDILSQLTLKSSGTGTTVRVDAGQLFIDDSVLQLGTGTGAALVAKPTGTTASTVSANQLTVVEGGAGSVGVLADATAATSTQNATVTLQNSIVRGPATSLRATAAATRTATVTPTYTDYVNSTTTGPGTATVTPNGAGNLTNVDPAFINPAAGDYDLRAGSPVIDKGIASAAQLDRAGRPRAFDGDRNGSQVPDLGAYELTDVTPPVTTITSGPIGPTNDNTPLFTFRGSADATFECQLDGSAYQKCTSPVTTTPLADGPHTFTVRATDEVFNVEAAPPTRSFTVDTTAPETTITKSPARRFYKPKVKLRFVTTEAFAKFQCQIDGQPWRSCTSPLNLTVALGRHTVLVRSVDAVGNIDPTPASATFKRVKRPKPHHHHGHHRPHHHR